MALAMRRLLLLLPLFLCSCGMESYRYAVATHDLPVGTIIKASDISWAQGRRGRLTAFLGNIRPDDRATAPSDVIGHKVLIPLYHGPISRSYISK